jgi:thiol-disulfide isomerase/thioredoxin
MRLGGKKVVLLAGLLALSCVPLAVALPVSPGSKSKTPPPKKAAETIRLTVVDCDQLNAILKTYRDKIVVMDIWASFCPPCRKQFPNLLKLQKRHVAEGVICISVSVDDFDHRDLALAFLKAKHATIDNYLLDEDAAVWQDEWRLNAIPAVFVFDRRGRVAAKFDHNRPGRDYTYDDVEDAVEDILDDESHGR